MRLPLLAALVLSAVLAPRAQAAESYDGCAGFIDTVPAVLSTQGVWCLRKDLVTSISSGQAILIDANNVTIDCNGYKIGDLGAGDSTEAVGILSISRLNGTVRNCNIRGFFYGVNLADGGGALVEDNLLESNTYTAITIEGDGAMIRRNRVIGTGGSSAGVTSAFGIRSDGIADILDNTVSGVTGNFAYGIYANGNLGGAIVGNRVRGLSLVTASFGISSTSTGRYSIRENTVIGPGTGGIYCNDNLGTSTRNVVGGFIAELSTCTSAGDVLNNN